MRRVLPLLAAAVLAAAAGATLSAAPAPDARATAIVAQISSPGAPDVVATALSAPPDATESASFAYPSESPVVRVGSASAAATAQPGVSSSAQASLDLLGISLFGGEVRADSILLRATVAAGAAGSSADTAGTQVTGLAVLGQPVTPTPGARVPLADWGALEVLAASRTTGRGKARTGSATVTGLRVTLTAEHGGLAAGTTITLGLAEAFVRVPPGTVAPRPRRRRSRARRSGSPRLLLDPLARASRGPRFPAHRRSSCANRPP